MLAAFIHYHLRGGGVTRVIRHAVETLKRTGGEYIIFSGEPPATDDVPPENVCVLPELAYGAPKEKPNPELIVQRMLEQCKASLSGTPDVWHFHNHALGKNVTVPLIVDFMAKYDYPLLLQLHDFVEDNRPANYEFLCDNLQGTELLDKNGVPTIYPRKGRTHYAVLNQRDKQYLQNAGVPSDRLDVLPNAVWLEESGKKEQENVCRKDSRPLFVYPGRAIRRKNIGEFLLWAGVCGEKGRFAITLEPKNPVERTAYNAWVDFTEKHNLPVEFNYGVTSGLSFPQILREAEAVFTTSICEGFGMAFLEPWLVDTPVYGRNLPGVTDDFKANKVDLSTLYDKLMVPVEWIDIEKFRKKVQSAAGAVWKSYRCEMPEKFPELVLKSATENGMVDFAKLDEEDQRQVITKIIKDPQAWNQLNPSDFRFNGETDENTIVHNHNVVQREYLLDKFGERLLKLYEKVSASDPGKGDNIPMTELLDCFMAPEQFYLLRFA